MLFYCFSYIKVANLLQAKQAAEKYKAQRNSFFFVSFLDGVGIGEAMKTCQDLA